jgi:hypothetical protein
MFQYMKQILYFLHLNYIFELRLKIDHTLKETKNVNFKNILKLLTFYLLVFLKIEQYHNLY